MNLPMTLETTLFYKAGWPLASSLWHLWAAKMHP